MKPFAFFLRPLVAATPSAERSGPALIDPKDYKHIAGGAPRGTWAAATPTATDRKTIAAPRGTW